MSTRCGRHVCNHPMPGQSRPRSGSERESCSSEFPARCWLEPIDCWSNRSNILYNHKPNYSYCSFIIFIITIIIFSGDETRWRGDHCDLFHRRGGFFHRRLHGLFLRLLLQNWYFNKKFRYSDILCSKEGQSLPIFHLRVSLNLYALPEYWCLYSYSLGEYL